jgi:hypothetical protein
MSNLRNFIDVLISETYKWPEHLRPGRVSISNYANGVEVTRGDGSCFLVTETSVTPRPVNHSVNWNE